MKLKAIRRLALLLAVTSFGVSALKVICADAIKSGATVAPAPVSIDPPGGAPSKVPPLSASGRLGLSFSPPPKTGENPTVLSPSPPAIFPDPVSPGTVILSPFLVTTPRVKLTERDILTAKGRLALAQKQQLTPLYRVTFGPLSQLAAYYFDWTSILGGWHPNQVEAMVLYRQEEALRKQREMDYLIRLETLDEKSDAKKTPQLKELKPLPQLRKDNGIIFDLTPKR
jgi:hypothetical protein